MNQLQTETLLSRNDAAKFLGGICLTTLHRLKIPKLRIRRRVFYRHEDLKCWLVEQAYVTEIKND